MARLDWNLSKDGKVEFGYVAGIRMFTIYRILLDNRYSMRSRLPGIDITYRDEDIESLKGTADDLLKVWLDRVNKEIWDD